MSDLTLTDHQWAAVNTAADWYAEADSKRHLFDRSMDIADTMLGKGQDFFLGGYAGTGKSTILPALIEKCGLPFDRVAFVAPTGKAAKVMSAKLRDFDISSPTSTIHKLIYLPKAAKADVIEKEIGGLIDHQEYMATDGLMGIKHWSHEIRDLSPKDLANKIKSMNFDLIRAMDDDSPKFSLRGEEDFPEDIELIVCDEGSMVGNDVARDLATFGRPILAMGDPGQLPPVQDVYGFNCLKPDAFLDEIHRQAQDNPIIRLATRARNNLDLKEGDYGNGVKVVDRRGDNVTLDMDRDAMVLCGTHKKRWTLTKKIRAALGIKQSGPSLGEPLICKRNSKQHAHMVNGSMYENLTECGDLEDGNDRFRIDVKDVDSNWEYSVSVTQGIFEEHKARRRGSYSCQPSDAFAANRECHHFDFGHVLTTHSAQGSQWEDVVVHDESGAFRKDSSRWLYTAITRAEKYLTVVQ